MKIAGTVVTTFYFNEAEIKQFIQNLQLSQEDLQDIASTLAHNVIFVETVNDDDTIAIVRDNFNDGFEDMKEDLISIFGVPKK